MRSLIYLFQGLFIVALFACERPADTTYASEWNESEKPTMYAVSLYDTLPAKLISGIAIHEIHGIKASYASGRSTCYFEYDANAKDILQAISRLPFKRLDMAVADTLVREPDTTFSLGGKRLLSETELKASDFFWNIQPDQFTYYECLKSPARHTLLIHKKTGRILHRIEYHS